jgi:hypothetical protein
MKIRNCFAVFVLGLLCLSGTSTRTYAAVIVQNFNLSGTANSTFVSQIGSRTRTWQLGSLFAPFNIAAGDTLQVNINFASAITVQDLGAPSLEWAVLNYFNLNNSANFSSTYVNSGVTYSNTSGNFLGNPAPMSGNKLGPVSNPNGRVESLGLHHAADITSSIMTLSSISFVWNYTAIDAQTMPFFLGMFSVFDEAHAVPAPSALVILGLGLFGVSATRRKRARA